MNIIILGAGTAGLVTGLILREKYPNYRITVIKSGEIGIIGVGEGSTEHWAKFMSFVDIPLDELIYKTKATIKIGILFKDWNLGKEYVHSVSDLPLTGLERPDIYSMSLFINGDDKFPLSQNFQHIFYKNRVPLSDKFQFSNQYHFDTFKLNSFLLEKCAEANIEIVDAEVSDVALHPNGFVKGLIDKNGKAWDADFFIDCSGFKRIISSKLENKWLSMEQYLPCNHAIAFPTEFNDPENIEPYTTATALKYGWAWKIPTQERYGNGYVFCDKYINSDQALSEISTHLGKNIEKAARDIKFSAGRVEKFWCKNVVNVGLSGSFAEPLEAQSIGFTIVQAFSLINHLDTWRIKPEISNSYNELMNDSFDNVISYLQAHYLTNRNDTDFWKDKPFDLTAFNKEHLELFKKGIIEPVHFKKFELMFNVANWYQVIHGVGLLDREFIYRNLNSNRNAYVEKLIETVKSAKKRAMFTNTYKHSEFLKIISDNYNNKGVQ